MLAGAELVHAISGFNALGDENYSDMVLTLAVLELLWRRYKDGHTVAEFYILQQPWLFKQHSISADRWTPIRNKLINAGLLRIADNGQFIIGRDLSLYSLWDLSRLLGYNPEFSSEAIDELPEWFQLSSEHILAAKQQNIDTLSIPLIQLFDPTQSA